MINAAASRQFVSKRSHERFQVKDRTLAVLDVAIPFHIIEISKSGLAFRYIGTEKWFTNPTELDLVCEGLKLNKIPVRTISDMQVESDLIQMRRHSVTFGTLSESQLRQLEQFITRCMN